MNLQAVAQMVKTVTKDFNTLPKDVQAFNKAKFELMAVVGKNDLSVFEKAYGERYAEECRAAINYILDNKLI